MASNSPDSTSGCSSVDTSHNSSSGETENGTDADTRREELGYLFNVLPLELIEMVLTKTTVTLFVTHHKTREAEQLAFTTLSSVSRDWWQTINGWPESNTRRWFRHKTRRQLEHVCRPYARRPPLESTLQPEGSVEGVTQLDDRIYVGCYMSDIIRVFDSHYKRLKSIRVEGLEAPRDIVVCRESRVMYVADFYSNCVWRVTEKHEVKKFMSNVSPLSLSVTSRRLLVTPLNRNKLFRADGKQLKQVSLPHDMEPHHAVETDNNTFVVCHNGVSEVDFDGHVIRVCSEALNYPYHLALDVDGRVFVADPGDDRVLLLNKQLQLERVLLDYEHDKLIKPLRLCYVTETGRLLVGEEYSGRVKVYSLMN